MSNRIRQLKDLKVGDKIYAIYNSEIEEIIIENITFEYDNKLIRIRFDKDSYLINFLYEKNKTHSDNLYFNKEEAIEEFKKRCDKRIEECEVQIKYLENLKENIEIIKK